MLTATEMYWLSLEAVTYSIEFVRDRTGERTHGGNRSKSDQGSN